MLSYFKFGTLKYSQKILYYVIFLLSLSSFAFISFYSTGFKPEEETRERTGGHWEPPSDASPEEVFQHLELQPAQRGWAQMEIYRRINEPEIISKLLEVASGEDRNAVPANWLLYQSNNEPDKRLAFMKGELSGEFQVSSLLFFSTLGAPDSEELTDILPVIKNNVLTESGQIKTYSILILGTKFLDLPEVQNLIFNQLGDDEHGVIEAAFLSIKQGLIYNKSLLKNKDILSILLYYLNESTDPNARFHCCQTLRSYVGNYRVIRELTKVFRNDETDSVRAQALLALDYIAPNFYTPFLALDGQMDSYSSINDRSSNIIARKWKWSAAYVASSFVCIFMVFSFINRKIKNKLFGIQ